MKKALRPFQRSEEPRRRARLGALATGTLAVFAACTTADPREFFRPKASGPALGAGGGTAGSASSGSRAGSSGAGRQNGPDAGAGATAPRGGRDGGGNTTGDSGENGVGANDGEAGQSAAGTNASSGGTNGHAGSGANAGSGNATSGGGGSAGSGGTNEPGDSCGERPVSSEPFTKSALRAAAADCAVWHYCKFEAEATRLEERTQASAADPTPENVEAAQESWRRAMAAWSAVELFQFGPLSSRAESEGKDNVYGQGLRELVYAWPRFTRCRVEEQIATQRYATQGFGNVPIAGRGLFGIEYLLFYAGADTECTAGSATANTWGTLDAATLDARKRAYLTALSADVHSTIRKLIELWSPTGGNFRETFVNATGYTDEQQAMTILAWSLIYAEREVKDWKLGVPLGVTATHPVTGPEAPFARYATDSIRQNLRGFRALFQGCGPAGEGLGFDDWLSEVGHTELAQDILAALDAADSFAQSFPPLDTATASELESFYVTIKALTDFLKSDLFGSQSPLNLKLPQGVEGDTD